MSKCPYCDYETPEPDDGDPFAQGWQEVAHMNLAHPSIIAARLKVAGIPLPDDLARFGND